jgi:xanthine dehydrogenase accessory factor
VKPPTSPELLAGVERHVARGERVALCQIVRTEGSTPGRLGWKMVIRSDGSHSGNLGGGAFEALVQADARAKLAEAAPAAEVKRYYLTESAVKGEPTGMVCGGMAEVLLEILMPNPLLVICGGGLVGQALAANAAICDFDLLLVEDRPEFRRPELFPAGCRFAEVDRDYSQPFLAGEAGREVLAAVVTRCWETDLAALQSILGQAPPNLRYLGLLGSRRKVARVREELEGRGAELAGAPFFAPVGVPIGADSPAEIAVSILAEIIGVRSGKLESSRLETTAAALPA